MTTQKEFETRFARTGRDIDEMVADTQSAYRQERQALKDKWEDLKLRKDKLGETSEEAWDKVKVEFEKGWNDIKNSYEDLKDKLSDDYEEQSI